MESTLRSDGDAESISAESVTSHGSRVVRVTLSYTQVVVQKYESSKSLLAGFSLGMLINGIAGWNICPGEPLLPIWMAVTAGVVVSTILISYANHNVEEGKICLPLISSILQLICFVLFIAGFALGIHLYFISGVDVSAAPGAPHYCSHPVLAMGLGATCICVVPIALGILWLAIFIVVKCLICCCCGYEPLPEIVELPT